MNTVSTTFDKQNTSGFPEAFSFYYPGCTVLADVHHQRRKEVNNTVAFSGFEPAVVQSAFDRCRQGAAFLDKHLPGWRMRVRSAPFIGMSTSDYCVLALSARGQKSPLKKETMYSAGDACRGFGISNEQGMELGFYTRETELVNYRILELAWKEILAEPDPLPEKKAAPAQSSLWQQAMNFLRPAARLTAS